MCVCAVIIRCRCVQSQRKMLFDWSFASPGRGVVSFNFLFFSPNNFPFLLIYTNSEGLLIERIGRIKGQFLGLF